MIWWVFEFQSKNPPSYERVKSSIGPKGFKELGVRILFNCIIIY